MEKKHPENDEMNRGGDMDALRLVLFKETFQNAPADANKIQTIIAEINKLEPIFIDQERANAQKEKYMQTVCEKHRKESFYALETETVPRKSKSIWTQVNKVVAAFLVVFVVFGLTSGVAYAFGINLFEIIGNFSQNRNQLNIVLNQQTSGSPSLDDAPLDVQSFNENKYDSIEEAFRDMGVAPKMPTYIPLELEFGYVKGIASTGYQQLTVFYMADGTLGLSINICVGINPDNFSRYPSFENDYTLGEQYVSGRITAFIVSDETNNQAVWTLEDCAYEIVTIYDIGTLKKIINSFH